MADRLIGQETEARRASDGLAFFTAGFRPFFLAASLWSALALIVWMAMFLHGYVLPSRFDPLHWHIHEMLFGFVMAAVAGFLLTAIPNWTGRPPVQGTFLALLVGLWLLGRIFCAIGQMLPIWLGIAADLAFPLLLLVAVAHEIIAARNRPNMPIILPVTVLTVANLLMDLGAVGVKVPPGLGWRLGLAAVLVLISVIGGRIIPSFIRNWLSARAGTALPAPHGLIDRVALATLHAGIFAWVFLPAAAPTGVLLVLGALLNVWRLSRWQGIRTAAEPLLLILHLGYAWLCAGAALLGASILTAAVPASAGIHAITAGAFGTMILAVMTRATRGHSGHRLASDAATTLLYGCVIAAAVARVVAAFAAEYAIAILAIATCFWVLAFALFAIRYGPMLLRGRPQPPH